MKQYLNLTSMKIACLNGFLKILCFSGRENRNPRKQSCDHDLLLWLQYVEYVYFFSVLFLSERRYCGLLDKYCKTSYVVFIYIHLQQGVLFHTADKGYSILLLSLALNEVILWLCVRKVKIRLGSLKNIIIIIILFCILAKLLNWSGRPLRCI